MAYQKHEDYTEVFDVQNIYNVAKHLVKIAAETKDYVGGIKTDTDYMVDKWLYESCTTMAAQLKLIAGYENTENGKLDGMIAQLETVAGRFGTLNENVTGVAANIEGLTAQLSTISDYMTGTSAGGMAHAMSQFLESFQNIAANLNNVVTQLKAIAAASGS